ncbi:MAG TPA: twin-arginine translocase TatA/TatE family subunit [Thermoleophilia bacterium]|nr:twin-arginine translocase TatA/TatE family subunit [Thermoleophilia bacterium]
MSIGPAEIIVVLIIALLVFGPSRLPQMGRSLGRGVREFRKAAETAKHELGLDEVADQVNEVKSTVTAPVKEVTSTFGDLKQAVDVKAAVEAPLQGGAASGTGAAAGTDAPQAQPGPTETPAPAGHTPDAPSTSAPPDEAGGGPGASSVGA